MATSRERLNQTLNHIEPEEVVVDMGRHQLPESMQMLLTG